MALADVTSTVGDQAFVVELLASATSANGIPSGATAGIPMELLRPHSGSPVPDKIRVGVNSTAGSGTMTATLRVWLYAGGIWFVAKALAASSAAPQTAVAIAETSADAIAYSEEVTGLSGAARIFLELVAIAGSSTAVTGYAIVGG